MSERDPNPMPPIPTPELVIFDCDGVLVDSERITQAVLGASLRGHGWDISDAQVQARYKGGHISDIQADLEREVGAAVPEFIERFRAKMFEAFEAGVPQIAGVETVLDALDRAGVRTCVASNGPHVKMDATLGKSGLADRFAGRIFSADDVGKPKPAPDLFLHAARAMNAEPTSCLIIDDSPAGIIAGVAAGMTAIGFSDLTEPAALEAAGAYAVVTDLAELPGLLGLDD